MLILDIFQITLKIMGLASTSRYRQPLLARAPAGQLPQYSANAMLDETCVKSQRSCNEKLITTGPELPNCVL